MSWFRRTPLDAARWVVVDCETSGLDPARDRLLSVAAVEVAAGRIPAGRAFAAVLRQDEPSAADNILVHGLGRETQLGGAPAPAVLSELQAFMADAVPVAFHAPFDREVLDRALRRAGLRRVDTPWLDLAALAPILFPGRKGTDLDDWLAAFAIECAARHDALADAYASAQLLLVALAEARRQKVATVEALLKLAASAKWLPAG